MVSVISLTLIPCAVRMRADVTHGRLVLILRLAGLLVAILGVVGIVRTEL